MNFTLEKDLDVLVMCWYYNRPDLIIHAVNSVRNQTYKNWKLVIIDDCSDIPLEPIVKDLISEEESNKIFLHTNYKTEEQKKSREATNITILTNQLFQDYNSDIVVFLCDDDVLYHNYLEKLNDYYKNNLDVNYSYSNVIFFDSKLDNYLDKTSTHNKFEGIGKLVPHFRLDISQVSWRTSCMKKDKLFFKNGPHANFDAVFFEKLYNKYGLCSPNFAISQYKNLPRGQEWW